MLAILEQFSPIWHAHVGCLKNSKHGFEMNASDTGPIHLAPNLVGYVTRAFQKEHLEKMKKMGVIALAQAKCAAPIVFAQKKERPLRFCTKYRKLNAATTDESSMMTVFSFHFSTRIRAIYGVRVGHVPHTSHG